MNEMHEMPVTRAMTVMDLDLSHLPLRPAAPTTPRIPRLRVDLPVARTCTAIQPPPSPMISNHINLKTTWDMHLLHLLALPRHQTKDPLDILHRPLPVLPPLDLPHHHHLLERTTAPSRLIK